MKKMKVNGTKCPKCHKIYLNKQENCTNCNIKTEQKEFYIFERINRERLIFIVIFSIIVGLITLFIKRELNTAGIAFLISLIGTLSGFYTGNYLFGIGGGFKDRFIKEKLKEDILVKEILKRGDLTAKEIKEELWRRNVSWIRSYNRRVSTPLFYPLIILWLLPAIAKWTGWGFLSFYARLPGVDFPIVVIVAGATLFIPAFSLVILVHSMRRRLGGCNDWDETVVIIKKGPYGIIRHPEWLGRIIFMPLLPIVLSKWIPYTIFAIAFSVVTTGTIIYYIREEDVLNIRKWGDEYRQYMKEAPAINFVKGLWSAMKKQREER